MRFSLVDRILDLQPGKSITTVKCLSLAEEYLADHFPLFPVLPGVLMLEAMTQSGAWLIRATEDFAHSIVVLKEARNIKYADFVEPGQVLTVHAEIAKTTARETHLKAQGTVNGKVAVGGRLVLERFNLAESSAQWMVTDDSIKRTLRRTLLSLTSQTATRDGGSTEGVHRGLNGGVSSISADAAN